MQPIVDETHDRDGAWQRELDKRAAAHTAECCERCGVAFAICGHVPAETTTTVEDLGQ